VRKVEDICKVGDIITVKYIGVDEKGRMNLSRKDALPPEPEAPAQAKVPASASQKSYRPRRPFRKPRGPSHE